MQAEQQRTLTRSALYRLVKEFRDGILDGNPPEDYCYMVSDPLTTVLELHGIQNRLCRGEVVSPWAQVSAPHRNGIYGHFWIGLPDGSIIDATASQFRRPCGRQMPAVYIGPRPEWYFDEFESALQWRRECLAHIPPLF